MYLFVHCTVDFVFKCFYFSLCCIFLIIYFIFYSKPFSFYILFLLLLLDLNIFISVYFIYPFHVINVLSWIIIHLLCFFFSFLNLILFEFHIITIFQLDFKCHFPLINFSFSLSFLGMNSLSFHMQLFSFSKYNLSFMYIIFLFLSLISSLREDKKVFTEERHYFSPIVNLWSIHVIKNYTI